MSLPGDLMAYSYTERKRIRKSFGSRDSVLEVPCCRCKKMRTPHFCRLT